MIIGLVISYVSVCVLCGCVCYLINAYKRVYLLQVTIGKLLSILLSILRFFFLLQYYEFFFMSFFPVFIKYPTGIYRVASDRPPASKVY